MLDAFLTNCRLADGRVVDIGIADGKIAIVGEGAAPASSKSPTSRTIRSATAAPSAAALPMPTRPPNCPGLP